MKSILTPYCIELEVKGITHNFHGFERSNGMPLFIIGYASFDTNIYFRSYKHAKNAIREAKKIRSYYDRRKMHKDSIVRVVDMVNDKVYLVVD